MSCFNGFARGLKTWLVPFSGRLGTMGCVLTAFNPDVRPPSNALRRGTVTTGSARGLKTWLVTAFRQGFALWHVLFNSLQLGHLAAPIPSRQDLLLRLSNLCVFARRFWRCGGAFSHFVGHGKTSSLVLPSASLSCFLNLPLRFLARFSRWSLVFALNAPGSLR